MKKTKKAPVVKPPEKIAPAIVNTNQQEKPFIALIVTGGTLLLLLIIYLQAIKITPQDPWNVALDKTNAANNIQDPAERSKKLAEAGFQFRQILEQHPYHARVWHFYAYYQTLVQQYDSAILSEIKAIELGIGGIVNQVEFEAAQGLCQAASLKLNSGQLNDPIAARNFIQSIKVSGLEIPCLDRFQGAVYTQLNMPDSALYFLNRIKLKEPDADIYYNIALNYFKKSDYDETVANLKTALGYNANHEPSKQFLSQFTPVNK
jgi:tetratricopeptide (TPR) repeat protein